MHGFTPVCDLKAAPMNVYRSLIWELTFYVFELVEATKNICGAKVEGAIDHRNEIVQKILHGLQEAWRSGKVR